MDPRIRPQRPEELDRVCEVTRAAFTSEPEVVHLVEALATDWSGRAGRSLVADVDGVVIGHVQVSRGWVDAAERLVDVLVLSPLSVLPEHQGRGLGRALVEAAVEVAAELGAPLLFLEGDPRLYRRFGFEPAARWGCTPPSERIPEPACQLVRLPAWESWMTGRIVYPDVFWRLDCVGLRGETLNRVRADLTPKIGSDREPVSGSDPTQ
jgi:putative acetyltransferase